MSRSESAPPARGTKSKTTARAAEAEHARRLLTGLAVAALALGVLLRLAAPFTTDVHHDGNTYVAMGHAWARLGEFTMPYGELFPDPEPSHHYPPAWPFYLGLVFKAFGYGLAQAQAAFVAMSLAALAVVYFTTRDLYGPFPALLATGLVALEPHLLLLTGTGFSESMSLAFFALTMWAIVKSLGDERFIVLAGLFAGLAYLSRGSMGWFFLVAGAGGFLWRFYHKRWAVLTNRWYLAAIAVFGSIVLAWAWRNVSLFGWPNWQTSVIVALATEHALANPGELAFGLLMKIPFFAAMLALYVAPFRREAGATLGRIREEETGALWLSVGLLWLLGWLMSGMFWTFEDTPLWWLDNHRYVLVGILPLAWIFLRERKPDRRLAKQWGALAAILLALSLVTLAQPPRYPEAPAAHWLDPHLRPGDEVAVAGGIMKYSLYAHLSQPEAVSSYTLGKGRPDPDFIVTVDVILPPVAMANYTHLASFTQSYLVGEPSTAHVYARREVAAERGIEPMPGHDG